MISRRGFIGAIATSVTGIFLAQHLPAVLPRTFKKHAAGRFLTETWNTYMKGKGLKDMPGHMTASAELFDAFEDDLVTLVRERPDTYCGPFCGKDGPKTLMFKCTTLHRGQSCPHGWIATIDGPGGLFGKFEEYA